MHIRFRKFAPLILILLISFLTSCSKGVMEHISDAVPALSDTVSDIVAEVSDTVSDYMESNKNPHSYAVETFNEVFEYVRMKDCQAIFDMFSEYNKEHIDLMPDIEKLVEFMDGEIIEIGHVGASNDYSSVKDGVTLKAGYSATSYVKNDKGVLYWVKVGVVTAADDESKLGLDWIYILDCDAKTKFTKEWRNWYENDGAKSTEPQIPESMDVGVNY